MTEPTDFLFDPAANGLYAAPNAVDALRAAAAAQEVAWCEFDLAGVSSKAGFLSSVAAALQFPAGFGHNLDALADCLEDLSWQPARGVVMHWRRGGDFARRVPEDFSSALEIFTAAASYWEARSRLMLVLLDTPSRSGHALPTLPRG